MGKEELYRSLLRKLLPKGKVWTNSDTSNLGKLLLGLADELARVDDRGDKLLQESDPRQAFELLTDWERITGLPDDCTGLAATLEERRNQVVAKLISGGTLTKQFYVDLAAKLGYTITVDDIEEFSEFKAGQGRAGDRLTNGGWIYTFAITAPLNTVRIFRAGANNAGDRLREFGDDVFECVITKNKQAHALVIFKYV